jgi:rhodanese-related sulfurtransferase
MNATLTMPDPAKAREFFNDKMEFTTGPVELKRAMDNGEVVVIDVRAAEDYHKAHIPGALSLPKDEWEKPHGLRRDKTNVLYCYSQVCHLAATAAIGLAEEGYPIKELEGGFEGWKQQDLPVETTGMATSRNKPAASERSPKQENL